MIALIVAAAFFMETLDGTVIATALPDMARSFGVGAIQLSISITAYILTLAIFLPASGWLADRFGTRTIFGGAIAAFTLASIACGLAPNFNGFIAARIAQGAAAALMSPVGRLVVLRATEKRDLLRAAAITIWPGLLAPVIGPPLGGFISTYASWRGIFLLNVPLGIVGVLAVLRYVPQFQQDEKRPFDLVGFSLSGLALGTLMYGFDRVGVREWWSAAALITTAIALGWMAVRHLERHEHPLVELSAMRVQSFSVGVWTGILFRMAVGATPVLLPLMFQRGFGMTAFAAGVLTLGYAIGNIAMKPLTSWILRHFGFRATLVADTLLSSLCIAFCGFLSPGTPVWLTTLLLILTGGFRSLGLTGLFTLPFVDVSPAQRTAANTLSNITWQVGIGLGVAFGSIALQASLLLRGADEDVLNVLDFRFAFVAVALIGAAALPGFLSLSPHAGAEVSGHRPRASAPAKG
ncbi:MAG TPA: MFS transporter [Micropepsaceae bacterium]|nr:MFS transporter [Micropepsaceae bacterium]